MFCRVEAIPYEVVRKLLDERKTWNDHAAYFDHLRSLPLGPNVASFVGHSALRARVMGIERSLGRDEVPTRDELVSMQRMLEEALDAGYLGASIQTLPWDKMGGDRWFRSRPLPSCFARWSEYRHLTRVLRRRGRVFQGVPDITTRVNIVLFLLESVGLLRPALKTTIVSMMDVRAVRGAYRAIGILARIFNRLLGANFRWQALPEVFDLWADGIDLVVFEEFGAGSAALHLRDEAARSQLLRDPAYRDRFRRDWTNRYLPRAFHRDFEHSKILQCPDATVVGKSFAEVARDRDTNAVDAFLDLVSTHGTALRWYTVMGNDRPGPLAYIVSHPDILVGFSDAGAHLRQMAHYNFPLRLLRLVRESHANGKPVMSIERAVHRLTGEIADWLGLDAGRLDTGSRADIAVVDPEGLDAQVDEPAEAPTDFFGGYVRLVRRNPKAVRAVLVNGHPVVRDGVPTPDVGRVRGRGTVLTASA